MIIDYKKNLTNKTKIFNQIKKLFANEFFEKILIFLFSSSKLYNKIIPQEYLYKANSIRKIKRDGISYELDISKVVDHGIYFNLSDPAMEKLISSVKENYISIDIGANIGTTSLRLAKKSPNGKVISFEPSESNYNRFLKNLSLNNVDTITLVKMGLGDRNEVLKLYNVDENNHGMKMILNSESEFPYETITITTLDEYISKNNIDRIDLIKIDVEGFEKSVLNGAINTIVKFRPVLFVEVIDYYLKNNGSSAKEIIHYFDKLEYTVYNAHTNQILNANQTLDDVQFDIICYP